VADGRISADLRYLKLTGDTKRGGKYFTLFRPYHLWFLEAPISIARAYLHRQTTLVPLDRPVADVMTVTKRDLKPGDRLDDFGGYTFHGVMDRAEEAQALNALPVGLAPGAEVAKPVRAGKIVTWDDVRLDEGCTVVKLRRQQDAL
jgi:predicted homoserine dehydrogenase-like protein